METKPTLSDLLALRDGEPVDPAAAQAAARDPEAQATLSELERLRSELRTLPPVTPDDAVWAAIQERTAAGAGRGASTGPIADAAAGAALPGWLQRFPLATAATVFLAAALTIMLWDPTAAPGGDAPGPQVSDPVAQLMLRSRRLESELMTRAAAPALGNTSSEQALLYGIADVDAQLNALYAAADVDPAERERLWRQRVMLLESLADVQRGQAVLRPAIY
jgi:hypothetical protein